MALTLSAPTDYSPPADSAAPRCDEWAAIFDSYCFAAEAYSQAVFRLRSASAAQFSEAWVRSEAARKNCDLWRTELLDHELRHACQPG